MVRHIARLLLAALLILVVISDVRCESRWQLLGAKEKPTTTGASQKTAAGANKAAGRTQPFGLPSWTLPRRSAGESGTGTPPRLFQRWNGATRRMLQDMRDALTRPVTGRAHRHRTDGQATPKHRPFSLIPGWMKPNQPVSKSSPTVNEFLALPRPE